MKSVCEWFQLPKGYWVKRTPPPVFEHHPAKCLTDYVVRSLSVIMWSMWCISEHRLRLFAFFSGNQTHVYIGTCIHHSLNCILEQLMWFMISISTNCKRTLSSVTTYCMKRSIYFIRWCPVKKFRKTQSHRVYSVAIKHRHTDGLYTRMTRLNWPSCKVRKRTDPTIQSLMHPSLLSWLQRMLNVTWTS